MHVADVSRTSSLLLPLFALFCVFALRPQELLVASKIFRGRRQVFSSASRRIGRNALENLRVLNGHTLKFEEERLFARYINSEVGDEVFTFDLLPLLLLEEEGASAL